MGTGYSRNDTSNNIADGNIINAADLDGEFDAIQSAFNASTGHTHDGTTAEGAPITVTGPAQDYVSSATEFRPKTNNTYDLGSLSLQWKDLYVDGTGYIDSVDIDGGAIDGTTIGGSSAAAGTFTNLTATGTTTLAGASTTADITFGDNDKAIFGAGSDLQIYSVSGNSFIQDTGTGSLFITGANSMYLQNGSNETYIDATTNGAVRLFYDNANKLDTTSTGVDVTGTVTADGLITDTTNGIKLNTGATAEASWTHVDVTGTSTINVGRNSTWGGKLIIQTDTKNRANFASNGDISFYEDTGTTPKFFWDASAESLGIGNSAPADELHITAAIPTIRLEDSNDGSRGEILYNTGSGGLLLRSDQGAGAASASNIIMSVDGTERMRITSAGNVGIGTDSPAYKLVVSSGGASGIEFGPAYSGTANLIQHYSRSGGVYVDAVNDAAQHRFNIGGSEKVRIAASGNVGIGTTSPTYGSVEISKSSLGSHNALSFSVRDATYGPRVIISHDTTTSSHLLKFDSSYSTGTGFADFAFMNGNVGIGTTSPSADLHVSSSGDTIARVTSGDGFGAFLDLGDASDPDGGRIVYDSGSNLTFNTASTERMRITSTGSVGIGTSSPNRQLQVESSGTATFALATTNYSASGDPEYSFGEFDFLTDDKLTGLTAPVTIARIAARANTASTVPGGELAFYTNGYGVSQTQQPVERMRIDVSGNVGIGTTSPSFELDVQGASDTSIRVRATGAGSGDDSLLRMQINNADASNYIQFGDNSDSDAGYIRYQHANDSLQIGVNASEAMRIDSGGAVLINASSPSGIAAGWGNLFVGSTSPSTSNAIVFGETEAATESNRPYIMQRSHNGAGQDLALGVHSGSGVIRFFTGASSSSVPFTSNNAERMRLDNNGVLMIGSASLHTGGRVEVTYTGGGSQYGIALRALTDNTDALHFKNAAGGTVGSVSQTATATSYNTSSDYRLKEDVQPMVGASDRVLALNPVNFAWKADGTRVDGFLAHEAQAVVAEAVHGTKDEVDAEGNPVYQGIDQSKLVPLLTAALQEALGRIETLEAEVAALKA